MEIKPITKTALALIIPTYMTSGVVGKQTHHCTSLQLSQMGQTPKMLTSKFTFCHTVRLSVGMEGTVAMGISLIMFLTHEHYLTTVV